MRVDVAPLRCPRTHGGLVQESAEALRSADGTARYPVVDGVPVLIDEERSPFKLASYVAASAAPDGAVRGRTLAGRALHAIDRWLPSLSWNIGTPENYRLLGELLKEGAAPGVERRVLVVGGATTGVGFDHLASTAGISFVETDVAFGPRTQIVCDAHDLPFVDASFHAVVCQAVLEHVLDPPRVVSEIHRVLVPDGLVYSEVPFMQQVHGGAFDVTRFTLLGHRRLFRFFDELRSGPQGGPGMALAWSVWYLLRSCATSRRGRAIAYGVTRLLFSWLLLLDEHLVSRPAACDAASGTFFLGRRRTEPVSDEEILASYRGVGRSSEASPADLRNE